MPASFSLSQPGGTDERVSTSTLPASARVFKE